MSQQTNSKVDGKSLRKRKKGSLTRKYICELYEAGFTIKEIAHFDGTTSIIINRILHEENITIKERGYDKGKYLYKHGIAKRALELGISLDQYSRLKVIQMLGSKCISCGETDTRVLQINHVTGHESKKENLKWKEKVDIILGGNEHKLDIRCANCNVLYEHEVGRRTSINISLIEDDIFISGGPVNIVSPMVYIIGETKIDNDGLQAYLEYIGVPSWSTNAPSDIEKLIEVYGKGCYGSYDVKLNPNLSMVRTNKNEDYIKNIIEKGDGSVLEHGFVNFYFVDVSRVFTAELCRHRVGTAISEKSLRFVRLEELNWYCPISIYEDDESLTIFSNTFQNLSDIQRELSRIYDLDNQHSFNTKKTLTSAMRRLAPLGLATTIGWSANIRTIRHVIEMRTAPEAEEEIRAVFGEVGRHMKNRYPNLFADYEVEILDGYPYFQTKSVKV